MTALHATVGRLDSTGESSHLRVRYSGLPVER